MEEQIKLLATCNFFFMIALSPMTVIGSVGIFSESMPILVTLISAITILFQAFIIFKLIKNQDDKD